MAERLSALKNEFREFKPSVNLSNHYIELYQITANSVPYLEDRLRIKGDQYDLVIEEKCSIQEISAARFVPLLIDGNFADEDKNGIPLNTYPRVKCSRCLLPDDRHLPQPFQISEKAIARVQDIYFCNNGIVVLSEKFREPVLARFRNAVVTGDVEIVRSSKRRLKSRYFFLRPSQSVGPEIKSKIFRACPTCGAPTEVREIELADKIADARIFVTDYCGVESEIVTSGNWYGQRSQQRPMAVLKNVFVSGAAFMFLNGLGIRGLVRPSNIVLTNQNLPS